MKRSTAGSWCTPSSRSSAERKGKRQKAKALIRLTPCDLCLLPSALKASADAEQFHLEHQRRVRRNDAAGAARAVSERWRNGELALPADFHALYAFVPALDDAARAEGEHEGVVAILARIELGTVGEPAGVVHLDLLAGGGER